MACELEVRSHPVPGDTPVIVLRPVGDLDLPTVRALADAVDATRDTGAQVALALDAVTRFDLEALAALAHVGVPLAPPVDDRAAPVLLPTSAGWWMVDGGRRRLCRLDRPTHPLHVPDHGWVRYEQVVLLGGRIVATTPEGGRIVSGLRAA